MPTINDLRQQAATIKNATQVGENTATRVGTTFETIADLLEGMGGVTNLSTIDIGSIDTLNTTGDMLVGTPNIYTITKTIGANTFKVGTLFQFANNGRYDVAQVIVSQFIVDADGRIDTTSADQEVHIFYRLCKTMNGGSLPTPIGTWTTWTELGGSGGSGVTIDPYPTQNSGNAVSSGGVFERLQDIAPKVDISAIDDIDEYTDMLATKSPFYVVTKTLSGNVFRIGTLMEFANQGRYILYQILATDYVLNDDGTLDTTLSENGGLKLIWRMKQFSGNPPAGVTIGVWSAWSYLSGGGGGEVDAYTKSETNALLAQKQNTISDLSTIRSGASAGATAVQPAAMNTAINNAVSGKQNTLTFDDTPTAGSDNPVKSKGIKTYVDNADANVLQNIAVNYYTKAQIDNLIVPQGMDSVWVSSLPASGVANTLYLVSGSTSFSAYGWDGTQFVKMAEYAWIVDAYPTDGSHNAAPSFSVYDLQNGIIHPAYAMTTGAITPNGSIGSSTSYSYSSPIALKKGQKISVYSQGYGYAAVSEYDGSTYTPLVSVVDNPGTGVYVTSEYVAQSDMNVVVCVRSANAYDVYLDGGVKMLERQLDEIVNGKLIKITPVESSVTMCKLVASGTQSVIEKISNGNSRVAFFPVESGKSYKIHVASTRNGRAWGWCDSYISAAPSSSINLGGLVSPTTTSNGSVYDEVVTNDGGYSYICIPFTYNAGGATLEEIISGDVVTYKVQGKTSEEKAVARQNIGAASGSDMSQVLGRMLNNYLEGKGQTYVYKQIHGLAGGRTYRVVLKSNNWDISGITGDDNYKFLIRNDYNGSYTLLVGKYLPDTLDKYYDITIPANSDYITIGGRAVEGVLIEFDIIDYTDILQSNDTPLDTIIFSINHRGYSLVAPENTLPAFILSRKMGFSYVETDVAFTSDNVAVLMHDSTINRTARNSDGSQLSSDVYIYDITYAQALQYDYGIWKGSEWAGTQIPTFKEFIQCCKEMSLHPFIELKNSVEWTQARCEAIAEDIKAVGMERNVSFISFDENALAYMSAIFPDAMIGLGYQGVYNTQNLTAFLQTAASLKTSTNKVLVSLRYSDMTSSLYDLVSAAGVNSIVWTVNSATDATNLDDNTIGVLSDSLNAGKLIIEKNYQTLPI